MSKVTKIVLDGRDFFMEEVEPPFGMKNENKLTKEDVWGSFNSNRISKGMIIARSNDKCPIFKDIVPFKSVTIICEPEVENDVVYWIEHVQGAGSISKRKVTKDGKVILRADYMCW